MEKHSANPRSSDGLPPVPLNTTQGADKSTNEAPKEIPPWKKKETPAQTGASQLTDTSYSYHKPIANQARFTDSQSDEIIKRWICEHGTKQIREEFTDFSQTWLSRDTSLIWKACEKIESRCEHPDIITITQELRESQLLEQVGGVSAIMLDHHSWAVVKSSIHKSRSLYQKREAAKIGRELHEGILPMEEALHRLNAIVEASRGQESLFDALLKSSIAAPQLKDLSLPPRRKLIGDWLYESDLCFVFAPRGLGKTWFSLGLGVAIACKEEFGPWKVHEHTAVLYVDGEMPCRSLEQRIAGMGADDRMFVLNHESLFHLTGKVLNLTDLKVQDAVTRLCIEKGIRMMILDNLSCLFSGMKENDADDWESVLPWLLHLRRNGIAVVIVAHSGRNGNMRGTSRREDSAFSMIRLDEVPDKGTTLKEGAKFISRFTKDRNSQTEQPAIEWTIKTAKDGKTNITTKEADGMVVLIEWVRDGLTSATDIAKEMGLSIGQVSKMATKAIADGKLRKDGRCYALA